MGLMGTNSQGIATSVLAEWVKKVTELPLPETDKNKLDEYIDDIYHKVGECKPISLKLAHVSCNSHQSLASIVGPIFLNLKAERIHMSYTTKNVAGNTVLKRKRKNLYIWPKNQGVTSS